MHKPHNLRHEPLLQETRCATSLSVASARSDSFSSPPAVTTPATKWQKIVGTIHLTSAALLFSTLAYFCLKLFVISKQPGGPSPEKLQRNKVYKVGGWVIVGCIVGIMVFKFFLVTSPEPVLSAYPPVVFSAESIAIWAFGIAWLVKDELFLKDKACRQAQLSNTDPSRASRVTLDPRCHLCR